MLSRQLLDICGANNAMEDVRRAETTANENEKQKPNGNDVKPSEFWEQRERLNEIVLQHGDLTIKRFFNLDTQAYADGALPVRMKELLGLAASLVLRCDDCVMYHLIRCREEGVTDGELAETIAIAMVVGGSITIPHVRRAFEAWEELSKR